jgi:hypothetical protein
VLGKAPVGGEADQAVRDVGRAGGVPALAPRVVGQAFDDFAFGQSAKVDKSKLAELISLQLPFRT